MTLDIGNARYVMSGSAGWNALAHSIGAAFIELQQLEFDLISFLTNLTAQTEGPGQSFDLFASKTFGNLLKVMETNEVLAPQARVLSSVKRSRDEFIHKLLFHKYGGLFTTDEEFVGLIERAVELRTLFRVSRKELTDHVLNNGAIEMFAAERDPVSGEFTFTQSAFLKMNRPS